MPESFPDLADRRSPMTAESSLPPAQWHEQLDASDPIPPPGCAIWVVGLVCIALSGVAHVWWALR